MIITKKDLAFYLAEDRIANDIVAVTSYERFLGLFNPNVLWIFIKNLRRYEYYLNSDRNNLISRLKRKFYLYRYKKQGIKLGFTIPPNVCGPGLRIPHYGTIVIHPHAKIGANCVIQAGVNIGVNKGGIPEIGDNVYIGPGAKIFGEIKLGNDIAIGANSVVNKSFLKDNITIAGIPARIIGNQKANER